MICGVWAHGLWHEREKSLVLGCFLVLFDKGSCFKLQTKGCSEAEAGITKLVWENSYHLTRTILKAALATESPYYLLLNPKTTPHASNIGLP